MIKEVNEPCDCPFRFSVIDINYCALVGEYDYCFLDRDFPRECPLLKEDITVMMVPIKKT